MKKIKSSKGETLVETLYGMLIVSLSFIILAGGIVSAARINKAAREENVLFNTSTKTLVTNFEVTITYNTPQKVQNVRCYQTGQQVGAEEDDGYFYYEK